MVLTQGLSLESRKLNLTAEEGGEGRWREEYFR